MSTTGSITGGEGRQARDLNAVPITDLMHSGLAFCNRDASVAEIARTMATCRIHAVVVMGVSPDGQDPLIWGVVSDLDLLAAYAGADANITAGDLASEPVLRIRSTKSAQDAVDALVANGAHHLVVVDSDGHEPLGVVSTLDLAELLAG